MSAPASPLAVLARDMEDRIGDALDGLAALEQLGRSDDWTAGPEKAAEMVRALGGPAGARSPWDSSFTDHWPETVVRTVLRFGGLA